MSAPPRDSALGAVGLHSHPDRLVRDTNRAGGGSLRRVRARALIPILALLGASSSGCIYARIVYRNTPTLAAVDYFDHRVVRASPSRRPLERAAQEMDLALTPAEREGYGSFD